MVERASGIWLPAYIGLGSNLDDPRAQVIEALEALARLARVRLVSRSPLYRSAPMGPPDQPDYVNAVAALVTTLDAPALLSALQGIEHKHGRDRRRDERWGPRTLDLDLLVFGDEVIEQPGLTVPHPGIANRNFVLLPLASIAPDLVIPGLGRTATLAAGLSEEGLHRLEEKAHQP